MPRYCFICPECDDTAEVVCPMKDCSLPQICVCGAKMRRDFAAQQINAGNKEYAKTKWSDSLAISPDQVAEHKRLYPDIPIDNQCRPGFDNYRQHSDYLDKCGFTKVAQKRKRRGRRISGGKKAEANVEKQA